MAILKIARWGNPALRAPAQPVSDATAPAVHALVHDMVETMADAGGVGLAAPQVHVPLRIVVFHLPPERLAAEDGPPAESAGEESPIENESDDDADDDSDEPPVGSLHVFINPVITPEGEEQALGWEGCLSVPGMRGVVSRFTRIRYTALGLDGKSIEGLAEGFHARVIQHECDHLDGILYPMRMTDLQLLGFNDEFDRHPIGLPGAERPEGVNTDDEPSEAAE
ncbi:MAG: peptide deformylase [Alphaproteobacteria bacterium]|jgi:peptide deformylase